MNVLISYEQKLLCGWYFSHTWPSVDKHHGYGVFALGKQANKMDIEGAPIVVNHLGFKLRKCIDSILH